MSTETSIAIRLVKPSDVTWSEASRGPEETEPPGVQFTAFEAGPFSTGFWERDEQARPIVRPYHEIAYIISGEVEVTTEDGTGHPRRPGRHPGHPEGLHGLLEEPVAGAQVLGHLRGVARVL